jgi:hypothetical protein
MRREFASPFSFSPSPLKAKAELEGRGELFLQMSSLSHPDATDAPWAAENRRAFRAAAALTIVAAAIAASADSCTASLQ